MEVANKHWKQLRQYASFTLTAAVSSICVTFCILKLKVKTSFCTRKVGDFEALAQQLMLVWKYSPLMKVCDFSHGQNSEGYLKSKVFPP